MYGKSYAYVFTPMLHQARRYWAEGYGGLTMAGISHVFTISRVADMLGEDEDLLQEISIEPPRTRA